MILVRLFFLLMLLAGGVLALGYPFYAGRVPGGDLGTWQVYDAAGGFRPATVALPDAGAPLEVLVDVVTEGEVAFGEGDSLIVTVAAAGGVLLETGVGFAGVLPRMESPQAPQRVYRQRAGMVQVGIAGPLTVTVSQPADAPAVPLDRIEVVLRRPSAVDPRLQPVGFALLAIGFVGLAVTFRRKPPANPNSTPPPRRWGRQQ